jgi:hypothetical protein
MVLRQYPYCQILLKVLLHLFYVVWRKDSAIVFSVFIMRLCVEPEVQVICACIYFLLGGSAHSLLLLECLFHQQIKLSLTAPEVHPCYVFKQGVYYCFI